MSEAINDVKIDLRRLSYGNMMKVAAQLNAMCRSYKEDDGTGYYLDTDEGWAQILWNWASDGNTVDEA